jgi:hypothetical protein
MSMPALADARRRLIRRGLLWFAFALWIVSLALPAVSESRNPRTVLDCSNPSWANGWLVFVGGPLGIMVGQFGWLANPLMVFAAFKRSIGIAAIAVGLGVLTAFTFTSVPNDIDANRVCGFGAGFYFWLGSMLVVLIAALTRPVHETASS